MANNLRSALDRGIQVAYDFCAYDFCCTVGHKGAYCPRNGNVLKTATPVGWQKTSPTSLTGLWAFLDFKTTKGYGARRHFLFELGQLPFFALRRGEAVARGWEFTDAYKRTLMKGGAPVAPQPHDVFPSIQQKGVDMRIGMDVAALAIKRLVERIILFSGDTDMIPAMKLARREGLQVFVVKLDPWPLKRNVIEDSDGVRVLTPKP